MTRTAGTIALRWPVFLLIAAGCAGLGAASASLWPRWARDAPATTTRADSRAAAVPERPADRRSRDRASPSLATGEARSTSLLPDVVITLSPEMASRAGIEVRPVRVGQASDELRLPGVIQANAYRQVVVTPLVAGRVTRVPIELGASVRHGQSLAEIYSPELVEAQSAYVSRRAELDAAHQRLRRTERLVEIGASSREELEQAIAEHTRHAAAVEGARSRLTLLGLPNDRVNALTPASEMTATLTVPSPLSGVVLKRDANPGLVVNSATALFTIADLSSVWVVGSVYERDLHRVGVGSAVRVTSAALPGASWEGRISYIDPQIAAETRTAQVRVEVPNRDGRLRLAMYAEMTLANRRSPAPAAVARAAVQSVGDRQFVYLAQTGEPGRFIEREVRLGREMGSETEVIAGLQPGDVVVTSGSFLLRAERERRGLRPETSGSANTVTALASVQKRQIDIAGDGFTPDRLNVRAGVRLELTFVRRTQQTCATEVVFPSLNLRRQIPLNTPTTVTLTPEHAGELVFTCGMDMVRGTLIVQSP